MKVGETAPQVGFFYMELLQIQETADFHVGSGLKTVNTEYVKNGSVNQ
jgi:hypothetical protein